MNFKALANAVTSKVGRQVLTAQKHSPTILFGAGIVGVVATAVLASRATLKLEPIVDEAQEKLQRRHLAKDIAPEKYSDADMKSDTVLIYVQTGYKLVKLYAPAVVMGTLSIAALTGSHILLNRRNVALTAAYAALDKGFKSYRERVVKALGPEADAEFRYDLEDHQIGVETDQGVVEQTIKRPSPKSASIYARFFDETNPNWYKNAPAHHNQMFLQTQQQYANDLLRSRGHIFLNEVYDMLHLERSKEGAIVGWVWGGDGNNYVDFGVFEGDRHSGMRFVNGDVDAILLDFNVDGVIYDKI